MNEVKITSETEVKAAYLTASELKLAASLMYQSYHDDPVFVDIFSDGSTDTAEYEQKLRASIREELNAFWQAKQPASVRRCQSGERFHLDFPHFR